MHYGENMLDTVIIIIHRMENVQFVCVVSTVVSFQENFVK
jgi:hypothetical protein